MPEYVLDEGRTEELKRAFERSWECKIDFKIIWMPPLEYLKLVGRRFKDGEPVRDTRPAQYPEYKEKRILEAYTKGIGLPPLEYFVGEWTGRKFHGDGKNRAYWAWKLGIEKVPVLTGEKINGREERS